MREKIPFFVNLAKELMFQKKPIFEIVKVLKDKGASLAMSVVSLHKIGFTLDEIDEILDNSPLWKDEPINLTDLFFEYVELDDDLIE